MSHQQKPAEAHDERKRWIELSVPQLLAGALAAASAAVAASWLGVAGTVAGAVVASLVVSVSSAVYARPIERSSQVIRESLPVIPVLPDRYRDRTSATTETRVFGSTSVQTAVSDDETVADRTVVAGTPIAEETESGTPAVRPKRQIRWQAVAVSSLAILVIGFGVLTAFEAVIGKSASSLTGGDGGGSTISRIVDSGSGSNGSGSDNDKPTKPTKPTEPTPTEPTEPTPTEPTNPTPTEPTDPTPTEPTDPTPTQPSTPDAGTTVPQDGQDSQDAPGAAIATDPA